MAAHNIDYKGDRFLCLHCGMFFEPGNSLASVCTAAPKRQRSDGTGTSGETRSSNSTSNANNEANTNGSSSSSSNSSGSGGSGNNGSSSNSGSSNGGPAPTSDAKKRVIMDQDNREHPAPFGHSENATNMRVARFVLRAALKGFWPALGFGNFQFKLDPAGYHRQLEFFQAKTGKLTEEEKCWECTSMLAHFQNVPVYAESELWARWLEGKFEALQPGLLELRHFAQEWTEIFPAIDAGTTQDQLKVSTPEARRYMAHCLEWWEYCWMSTLGGDAYQGITRELRDVLFSVRGDVLAGVPNIMVWYRINEAIERVIYIIREAPSHALVEQMHDPANVAIIVKSALREVDFERATIDAAWNLFYANIFPRIIFPTGKQPTARGRTEVRGMAEPPKGGKGKDKNSKGGKGVSASDAKEESEEDAEPRKSGRSRSVTIKKEDGEFCEFYLAEALKVKYNNRPVTCTRDPCPRTHTEPSSLLRAAVLKSIEARIAEAQKSTPVRQAVLSSVRVAKKGTFKGDK